MTAASSRVRKIVELVSALDESERAELEGELHDEDLAIGRAWADEIDRRASEAMKAGASTVSREQLTALLQSNPEHARSALSQMLASRR